MICWRKVPSKGVTILGRQSLYKDTISSSHVMARGWPVHFSEYMWHILTKPIHFWHIVMQPKGCIRALSGGGGVTLEKWPKYAGWSDKNLKCMEWKNMWEGRDFFLIIFIQHCFICHPSDSTVSEDAGGWPQWVHTIVSLALYFCNIIWQAERFMFMEHLQWITKCTA